MNKLKYLLILFLVNNINLKTINATNTEEKQSSTPKIDNTQNTQSTTKNLKFEEYIKDKKTNDFNKVSILFDINPEEENPEIWNNFLLKTIYCIKELTNGKLNGTEELELIESLLTSFFDNPEQLQGNISLVIKEKEQDSKKEDIKK